MNTSVTITACLMAFSALLPVQAQNDDSLLFSERVPIPWTNLREADVKYAKRVTRVVDMREKMNYCLQWPKNPFSKLLLDWSTMPGSPGLNYDQVLTAYCNDSLSSFYNTETLLERLTTEEIVMVPDSFDNTQLVPMVVKSVLTYDRIVKFRIMEDWFFDAKHSTFYPRIIAIAPVYKKVLQNGSEAPESALCWFRYEDMRPLMAKQPVFNRFNDGAMLSLDQYFEMRMFSSYIIKESNQFDLAIAQFDEFKDNGVDALLESERIKNQLFVIEHDLWQY